MDSESEDDFNPEPEVDSGDEAVRAQAQKRERRSPSNRDDKSVGEEEVDHEPVARRRSVDQEVPEADNNGIADVVGEAGDDDNEDEEEDEDDEEDDDEEGDVEEDEVRVRLQARNLQG